MKIAICVPSYNEFNNIKNITKQIDNSLKYFDNLATEIFIVNCDNNSPDMTNKLFEETITMHKKISIVTSKKGKGVNIYKFFKFFIENEIDYGFCIDADLKSFKNEWLPNIYQKLITGTNFVCPLYKRDKSEGNTTNHFVIPILYNIYGVFLRQPIGGDYGFDKHFVKTIMRQNFTENILQYGIDIFMVVTAIVNKMNISEVYLGEKTHNPSYMKMLDIFTNVVKGFSEVYKHYPIWLAKKNISYITFKYDNSICYFRKTFEKKYISYLNNLQLTKKYNSILENWINLLNKYLMEIDNISEDLLLEMKQGFLCRVVSFWDKVEQEKILDWEKEIIKSCYLLEEKWN